MADIAKIRGCDIPRGAHNVRSRKALKWKRRYNKTRVTGLILKRAQGQWSVDLQKCLTLNTPESVAC